MGLTIAIGSGALLTVTLAVWLAFAYRRIGQLEAGLASANAEAERLSGDLTAANAKIAKVTRDSADQAARDAVRIAGLEHELDATEADAIERGLAPGGDLAKALSRAGLHDDHELDHGGA